MKPRKISSTDRIIDANINRLREGLRVCEEITRFVLNSRLLTEDFKKIRHSINLLIKRMPAGIELIKKRDSLKDIGSRIYIKDEFRRSSCEDIFFANMQRVKESARVLEEFSKLKDVNLARGFKKIRYAIYETEKRIAGKIPALRDHR
ncbi:MAG: thiamine-phosphate pyrophosphorylase [Candidatus Omnitrophota bacterium]